MPPFVGVAVKLMEEPAQILGLEAATVTVGITVGMTTAEMVFERAPEGNAQVALEISATDTASLLANVAE
ncbi:UNVERIFIED_CONTAM: hypothetical protein IGO34_24300, partial [Salmonella enterica subsp. enterica serovar Weltevreden]